MSLFGPPNIKKLKARRDVAGLIKALDYRKDIQIRYSAATALGELKEARAIEPLIEFLRETDKRGRDVAAQALGCIGDALAVDSLLELLKDDAKSTRLVAVDALGNVGSQKAIEPLVDVLEDSDVDIRNATATALDRLGWQPGRNVTGVVYWIAKLNFEKCVEAGAVALKPLITALKDRNWSVQYGAANALGELRDAGAVEELVAMLQTQEASGLVVRVLGEIGDPRAIEPLIAVLDTALDRDLLAGTAEALGQIGDPHAVKTLVALLKNRHLKVQYAAVRALGKIGDPSARPDLRVIARRPKSSGVWVEGGYYNDDPGDGLAGAAQQALHEIKQRSGN